MTRFLLPLLAGSSLLLRPFMDSQGAYYDLLDQFLEATIFCVVGLVIGVLSDRRDKQTSALELTTIKLGKVYRELQENFERMKRAERLYALGQLSAGLAHEIRNPLGSMELFTGLLADATAHLPETRQWITHLQAGLRALSATMTNVVYVYINYLRRKVDSDYERALIRTVRGVGYQIGGSAPAARSAAASSSSSTVTVV